MQCNYYQILSKRFPFPSMVPINAFHFCWVPNDFWENLEKSIITDPLLFQHHPSPIYVLWFTSNQKFVVANFLLKNIDDALQFFSRSCLYPSLSFFHSFFFNALPIQRRSLSLIHASYTYCLTTAFIMYVFLYNIEYWFSSAIKLSPFIQTRDNKVSIEWLLTVGISISYFILTDF